MALSAQQQFFVEEYLRTFNATDSYMAARTIASEWFVYEAF